MKTDLLQIVLDNTSDGIILFDKEFKVLALNSMAKVLYKKTSGGDIDVGDDIQTNLNPINVDIFHQTTSKALNGKKLVFEYYVVGNNEKRWLKHTFLPVYDSGFIGVMWIVKDIHTEKMLEIQLREDEGKFRTLFVEAPISIIIVDEKGNILEANKETSSLFGYEATELVGQSITILIPERFHKAHEKYHSSYMKNPLPYRMGIGRLIPALLKNGQEIKVEVSLNSFTSFNKKYATAIIQDVSKRIENEQKIKEQIKQLQDIAWFQSHKVRHPLANIMGLVNLIKQEKSYNESYFNYLEEEANNLDSIIHKIVEMVYHNNLKKDEKTN